jgi:hypothetical protein
MKNLRRRLTNRHIRNLCQAHILDAQRKPKRCTNVSSHRLDVERSQISLCDDHFRMHQASKMIVIEKRGRQSVLVDCRSKGKSDESSTRK